MFPRRTSLFPPALWLVSLAFAAACASAPARRFAPEPGAWPPPAPPPDPPRLCAAPADETPPIASKDEPDSAPANWSFDLDAKRVAMIDHLGKVQIREAQTGQLLQQGSLTCDGEPAPCSYPKPRDIELVTGHNTLSVLWQDHVSLWSASPLQRRTTLRPSYAGYQRTATLARHGELAVLSQIVDRTLVTYDATTGSQIARSPWKGVAPSDGQLMFVDTWPAVAPTMLMQAGSHYFLWDAASLSLLATFPNAAPGTVLVRSPDSRNVLLLSNGSRQIVLDSETGKTVLDLQLKAATSPRQQIAHQSAGFSRDGSMIGFTSALQDSNGALLSTVVTLVDLKQRKVRHRLSLDPFWDTNQPAGFSRSGGQFCWRGRASCVAAVDTVTGESVPRSSFEVFSERLPTARTYRDFSMSFNDTQFEVSRGSPPRRLWRLPFGGRETDVARLVVSDDGRQVGALSEGPQGHLWVLGPDGVKQGARLIAEPDGVSLGPAGWTVVTWGKDRPQLTFWSPDALAPWSVDGQGRGVALSAWSPGGTLLATADLDGRVILWKNTEPKATPLDGIAASSLRFSPDGELLGASALDGTTQVWSTETGQLVGRWSLGLGGKFQFASAHSLVAHSPAWSSFLTVELPSGKSTKQADCLAPRRSSPLAISPDGRAILLSAEQGPVSLCNLDFGSLVTALPEGEPATGADVAFHPSGDRFASAVATDNGSEIRVRESRTGRLVWSLPQPGVSPRELHFGFTSAALAVQREGRLQFYPSGQCSPVEVQFFRRQGAPGWVAFDREGHFDGDDAGRAGVWHRGADGQTLSEEDSERLRSQGLLQRVLGSSR